jgi:hypothetical protein
VRWPLHRTAIDRPSIRRSLSPPAGLAARQSTPTFHRPGRRSGRSDGGSMARHGWNRIESHGQRGRRGRKGEDGGEEERRRLGRQGAAVGGGKSGRCTALRATSDERARGEEENAATMSAAMLLRGGATANDARRVGGGRCYIRKGADDNGKRRERALDDGSAT